MHEPERPIGDPDTLAIHGGGAVRPEGPPAWPLRDADVQAALERALADGTWGQYHGPHVPTLEQMLAAYHACESAILCASGTVAVELALRGVGVGPGDEVLLAGYDFKANFQNVLTVGAIPVLVDIHPDNWNLDVAQLPAAVGPKVKAILASHLHGGVVPMRELVEFAARHELAVIEDAAQMPGALIQGKRAGTWGDAGILSFGGSKLITAGRGGAVLTGRADVAQRIKVYTQRGNEAYPLSELQAAVILPQWARLDEANARRAAAARWLCDRLADRPGLAPFRNAAADSSPGYYKLGLQYDPSAFGGLDRDGFVAAVRAEGVALDAGFRGLHKTHAARRFRAVGDLRESTRADTSIVVLHHPVLLGSEADLAQVIEAIDKVRTYANRSPLS